MILIELEKIAWIMFFYNCILNTFFILCLLYKHKNIPIKFVIPGKVLSILSEEILTIDKYCNDFIFNISQYLIYFTILFLLDINFNFYSTNVASNMIYIYVRYGIVMLMVIYGALVNQNIYSLTSEILKRQIKALEKWNSTCNMVTRMCEAIDENSSNLKKYFYS